MNFFTEDYFKFLFAQKNDFESIIYRDNFVIIERVEHDLMKLRKASEPYYFGWNILKGYEIDYKKLGLERSKIERKKDEDNVKFERKIA
jgi:hypothetical protein